MCTNPAPSYTIVSFLFFGIFLITALTGTVSADDTPYQIIGNMKISPLLEKDAPIDDGTEIKVIEGWDRLKIWRQILLTRLSLLFDGTIAQDILILLSPFIFSLPSSSPSLVSSLSSGGQQPKKETSHRTGKKFSPTSKPIPAVPRSN